jgi:hypothetical protein
MMGAVCGMMVFKEKRGEKGRKALIVKWCGGLNTTKKRKPLKIETSFYRAPP